MGAALTTVDNVIAVDLCSPEEGAIEVAARVQLIEAVEEGPFREREDCLEIFSHFTFRRIISR